MPKLFSRIFKPIYLPLLALIAGLLVTKSKKAKVQKIQIGGKTGTARKIKNGIYSKDVITSFVGVFPIPKPKYLVFILFDEPRSENPNHNFYGGNTAAPIFSKVVSRIYPILDSSQMLKKNPYLGN